MISILPRAFLSIHHVCVEKNIGKRADIYLHAFINLEIYIFPTISALFESDSVMPFNERNYNI
jgi:hypothetical protein